MFLNFYVVFLEENNPHVAIVIVEEDEDHILDPDLEVKHFQFFIENIFFSLKEYDCFCALHKRIVFIFLYFVFVSK